MKLKLLVGLTCLLFTLSLLYYVYEKDIPTHSITESRSKKVEDALVKFLFPYIDKEIEKHYGESKQYYVDKILEIERQAYQYWFKIKIRVVIFEGPHNPPYGTDDITFMIDDKVYAIDYDHFDGHPNDLKR